MHERDLSCDLGLNIKVPDTVIADSSFLDKPENKLLLTTDGREVPQDLVEKMKAYAKELRRKQPQMKPKRLERKVAEHFKIKLV